MYRGDPYRSDTVFGHDRLDTSIFLTQILVNRYKIWYTMYYYYSTIVFTQVGVSVYTKTDAVVILRCCMLHKRVFIATSPSLCLRSDVLCYRFANCQRRRRRAHSLCEQRRRRARDPCDRQRRRGHTAPGGDEEAGTRPEHSHADAATAHAQR